MANIFKLPWQILLVFLLVVTIDGALATEYYVATDGNNALDGASEANAWGTITYAATQVQAGDTVHIKGGDYGHEHVVCSNAGTSEGRIIFDAYSGEAAMNGVDDAGYGIYMMSKSYISLSGFNITNYQFGILAMYSHNVTIDNTTVYSSYKGVSFQGTGADHVVRDVTTYNNDMHNIELCTCDDCLVEDCWSYNSDAVIPYADYCYIIHDYSEENVIRNCVAGQYPVDGGHSFGHGYAIRHNSSYNQISNCTSYYTSNEHYKTSEDSEHNEFINCSGYGFNQAGSGWGFGIKSSNNTVKNCRAEGMTYGAFIYYSASESIAAPIQGNVFENCVFVNNTDGVRMYNSGSGSVNNNTLKNSIIVNNSDGVQVDVGVTNGVLKYNNVWGNTNNYVGCSGGSGCLCSDPLFADYLNNDFHLQSEYGRWDGASWITDTISSPCIDRGDPGDAYSSEPVPNGGRINMGSYGNTNEASKTAIGTNNTVEIASNIDLPVGEMISVPISIGNSTGIAGVSMLLNYNSSVMEIVGGSMGNFTWNYSLNCDDVLNGVATLYTLIDAQTLTGDHLVGTIDVQAVGSIGEASNIEISDVVLCDDYGTYILPDDVLNGSMLISGTILGDADGSGTVDVLDVMLILQYLTYPATTAIDLDAADVCGNAGVDIADATLILSHCVDPDLYPLGG